jgi:hypothetical protein
VKRRLVVVALALSASVPGPASAASTLPGFRSPSGNISCLLVSGPPANLLCKLAHSDYAGTLQARCMAPDGAGVDWHGFTLGATRKGMVVCSGGILYTGRPSYVTLPYGATWRRGAFTCLSRVVGVTCRNGRGHGLFLSRQTWRAW